MTVAAVLVVAEKEAGLGRCPVCTGCRAVRHSLDRVLHILCLMNHAVIFNCYLRTIVITPVRWRLMEPIHEAESWILSTFVQLTRDRVTRSVRATVT